MPGSSQRVRTEKANLEQPEITTTEICFTWLIDLRIVWLDMQRKQIVDDFFWPLLFLFYCDRKQVWEEGFMF